MEGKRPRGHEQDIHHKIGSVLTYYRKEAAGLTTGKMTFFVWKGVENL
jgi:hypothetical protein